MPQNALRLSFALAVGLTALPARADWQFTRWGMTPAQVVAASGGAARLLPADQHRSMPPLVSSVEGRFQDGAVTLRTVFSFDTQSGGLACVFYGVADAGQSAAFTEMLLKRHGTPATRSSLPAIGMEAIGWRTATDEIDLSAMKGDAAFATQCRIRD